jgi:hypothetical protein
VAWAPRNRPAARELYRLNRELLAVGVALDDACLDLNGRGITSDEIASGMWAVMSSFAQDVDDPDGRHGLADMLRSLADKAAAQRRKQFDVVMAWSVDRLGRSLIDLISGLQELHAAKVDLFLHQQDIDTTTPGGKALFQMMGVFA